MRFILLEWSTTIAHLWWSWSAVQSTFVSTHLFTFLESFHIASISHLNQINSDFTYFARNTGYVIFQQKNNQYILQSGWVFTLLNLFRVFLSSLFTSTRIVVACIVWMRIKSCRKFLLILVTAGHFTSAIKNLKLCSECWINWSVQQNIVLIILSNSRTKTTEEQWSMVLI